MIVIRPGIWQTPPLRSNDRLHFMARARIVRAIHDAVGWELRHMTDLPATPIDYPVTVTLVWEVTDRRVRDVGAAAPTLKAAIDAMVPTVLARDSHDVVVEERYRIEVGSAKGVRIELQATSDRPMPRDAFPSPKSATNGAI